MSLSDWPYNAKSRDIAKGINWLDADPDCFLAPNAQWRRIAKRDIETLINQPQYASVRKAMRSEDLERISSLTQDHNASTAAAPIREKTIKERLIGQAEEVVGEAEASGDLRNKLNGIELIARLEKLMSTAAPVDPVVNIYVTTGVPRG